MTKRKEFEYRARCEIVLMHALAALAQMELRVTVLMNRVYKRVFITWRNFIPRERGHY